MPDNFTCQERPPGKLLLKGLKAKHCDNVFVFTSFTSGLIGLGVPFIVCKSITDWADGSKLQHWQTFGAKVSASFVKRVLQSKKFKQG